MNKTNLQGVIHSHDGSTKQHNIITTKKQYDECPFILATLSYTHGAQEHLKNGISGCLYRQV